MAAISKIRLVGEVDFFDTFEDEQIQYTKKAKDFQKLDVSYGDYSNSFTLPASKKNNRLFKYYYDVKKLDSFNPINKNETELFVNNELYSTGALSLISINLKNGVPQDYTVQYFADTINLKEALKDSKISDLDWSFYNHIASSTNIKNALSGYVINNLNGTPMNLKYPMWSAQNRLLWGWGNTAQNRQPYEGVKAISNATQSEGLSTTEVRPMILVSEVIDRIFNAAGYDYEIDLVGNSYYDSLYMWANNGTEFKPAQTPTAYVGTSNPPSLNFDTHTQISAFEKVINDDFRMVNPATGEIVIQTNGVPYDFRVVVNSYSQADVPNIKYRLKRNSGGVITYTSYVILGAYISVDTLSFGVNLAAGDIITMEAIETTADPLSVGYLLSAFITTTATNISALEQMTVSTYMPNTTCVSFLKSILMAFNAVIYWDALQNKFVIKNTLAWFGAGNSYDITKNIDTSAVTVMPPQAFKSYSLEFNESKAITNNKFQIEKAKTFGSTNSGTVSYFGDDVRNKCEIVSPLTTQLLAEYTNGTPTVESGVYSFFAVDDSYRQIDTGVVLAYYNGTASLTNPYKVINGEGLSPQTSSIATIFQPYNTSEEGLFFEEVIINGLTISNNLFTEFYQDYVSFIYNPTVRRYKATAYLPYNLVKSIKVNDNVTISGTNYLIEDMKINLTTLRVDFNLIINKL